MKKYLVIYEQEENYNYSRTWVDKNKYFDELDEALEYITKLKAFGKSWRVDFSYLIETKEIPVNIPQAEIQKFRDAEKQRKEERKKQIECQKEVVERSQLKRLKEKYEK